MFQNLGVCKGSGNTICQIRIGSDILSISKVGKPLYVLLNNRAILSAKSDKELQNKAIPVLSHIISSLMKRSQEDALRWKPLDKNYSKLMDNTLKGIKDNLRDVEVFILENVPDEITDNKSVEASVIDKFDDYRINFRKFGETINNIQHTSGILLKTNLEKDIWGSKDIMTVLNDIKANIADVSEDFDTIDACIEKTDDYVNKIQTMISKKIASEQVKIFSGKIIENFSLVKSFLSKLAQATNRLYSIDNVFKASMGYPATWFFDSSVFMPFLYEYDNLIDHMVKAASMESEVIEPLLVLKITGEMQCPII